MEAVRALSKDIIKRHSIMPTRVLAHSDIAPHRKTDPGEKFDWQWLSQHGVGHWVPAVEKEAGEETLASVLGDEMVLQFGDSGDEVRALQTNLHAYGYGVEITGNYDQRTQQVVTAFQRHYRVSQVDGCADFSTVQTLNRLLGALSA